MQNTLFLIIALLIFFIFILILLTLFTKKDLYTLNALNIVFIGTIQIFGVYLWINFDPYLMINEYNHGFQYFLTLTNNNWIGLNLTLGIDGFALIFILLTIYIFTLCIFATNNITKYSNFFYINLYVLELLLILVFSILDIFIFYICFESSPIPMFFIVGLRGSRSRRIKAVFYLFIYTMSTASLTLIGIFYIINQIGTTFYPDLLYCNFNKNEQIFLWICLFLTFATKIPMIPFHLWLPEAHVEAPTIGSVILASILSKSGGFGFIRYLIPLFPDATRIFLPLVFTLGIISVVYASLITLRQLDLKRIIAYSSIAHMNMVVLGTFALNQNAFNGAFYLMIGHGIVSSALFFAVGIVYDRFHTRLTRYYSGLIQIMPIFGVFFFLYTLGNIGFPVTPNFIGESLILIGLFNQDQFITILSGFGVIFAAIYPFWLYNRIFYTTLQIKYFTLYNDLTRTEFFIGIVLLIMMVIFGITSYLILNATLVLCAPLILNDPSLFANHYSNIYFFFIISTILSIIMVLIPYIITGRSLKMNEVISEYECGFEPFDSATRQPFTIEFYIIGILSLISDVELTLVLPWSLIFTTLPYQSIILMLLFSILLALGFLYEANLGVLNWGKTHIKHI